VLPVLPVGYDAARTGVRGATDRAGIGVLGLHPESAVRHLVQVMPGTALGDHSSLLRDHRLHVRDQSQRPNPGAGNRLGALVLATNRSRCVSPLAGC